MNTSTPLKSTDTDLISQNDIAAQSSHVALVMGGFCLALLISVSFIASILHSFFI